jgi:sortase A
MTAAPPTRLPHPVLPRKWGRVIGAGLSHADFLPPCGGGSGWGVVPWGTRAPTGSTPTPDPSPQGGGETFVAPSSLYLARMRGRTGRGRRPLPLSYATAAAFALAGLWLVGDALYIRAKAMVAQVLLDRAFAAEVGSGAIVKPWSWADTWPVARIEVPRLGAQAIVLAGGSGQALAFGPGHLERTPDAGEPGTAVYAAHRDTHFAFLGQIEAGDEIVVTRRDGATARFRVTHTQVVRWDSSGIDPAAPGRHLALVTCWPLDSAFPGPLRYVVYADVIS